MFFQKKKKNRWGINKYHVVWFFLPSFCLNLWKGRPAPTAIPLIFAYDHEVSSQFKWTVRWISPDGNLWLVKTSNPTCLGGFHHVALWASQIFLMFCAIGQIYISKGSFLLSHFYTVGCYDGACQIRRLWLFTCQNAEKKLTYQKKKSK